jgi:hypothetical protein
MKHTFAHEVGHTMALDDCTDCNAGKGGTIMAYPDPNAGSWITGPQYCDTVQVQQTAFPF